ncbi:unnamed protein product [Rotaria socialis]
MDGIIRGADLNLTHEQEALLPKHGDVARRSEFEDECKAEQDEWLNSLASFLSSLSEEQLQKLGYAFNQFANDANKAQEGVALARGMLKRAIKLQPRNFNNYRY